MFKEHRARVRADSVVEEAAETTRAKCDLTTRSNFSLTDLIGGALASNIGIKLQLSKYQDGTKKVPAYVEFASSEDVRTLNVERSVWDRASRGFPQERFILSHEIGHMVLHSHAELAFCENLPGFLHDLQEQEKAEHQANLFADCFLVPEAMLLGFVDPSEVAEHFNVTLKCAARRLFARDDKTRRANSSPDGNFCPKCMNFTMIRVGHNSQCQTIGCS